MNAKQLLVTAFSLLLLVGCNNATSAPSASSAPAAQSGAVTTNTSTISTDAAAPAKLNLNTVTGEELLATIPGFGNRMVREFEEYRPYVSIQQFRKEIGKYVDDAQVAEYEKYVYVPIDPNTADEATLQQIPGVDAMVSAQLVTARPYAAAEDFLKKLGEVAPSVDQAVAQSYLATK
jgi:DNA uptake protein ComE-like DNA-binding protein